MKRSRTGWLAAVALLSAGGLVAFGLGSLWRSARSSAAAADDAGARAAAAYAETLRGRLRQPEILDRLPPEFRFAIRGGAVVVPEGAAPSSGGGLALPAVATSEAARRAMREALREEFGDEDAEAARGTLLAALEDTEAASADRPRLLLSLARTELRAGRREEALRRLAELRGLEGARRDPELAAAAVLLAAALGLSATAEDAEAIAGLPEAQADAALERLAALGEERIGPAVAALRARRRFLDAIAAEAERWCSVAQLVERRGDRVLLWYGDAESERSGAGALVPRGTLAAALVAAEGPDARPPVPREEAAAEAFAIGAGLAVSPRPVEPAAPPWALALLFGAVAATFAIALTLTLRAVRSETRAARARADFLTSVTHELKTPLASIRLLAEMLEEGRVKNDERRAEYHRRLSSESARLTMLVENVLDLGRLERGERAYDLHEVEIDRVVRETLEVFEPIARREGLGLEIELRAGSASGCVDRGALAQVLLNLLDNALKYARSGGRVRIASRLAADGRSHELSVRDRGPGLPPEELEAVFARFTRGERERHGATPGLGLGLALARRILRDHEGELLARTPEDGGPGLELVWSLPASVATEAAS